MNIVFVFANTVNIYYCNIFAEIIDTLQADRNFRPTLHNVDCEISAEAKFIKRCWSAEPIERPDFALIKNHYRKFMRLVRNLHLVVLLLIGDVQGLQTSLEKLVQLPQAY